MSNLELIDFEELHLKNKLMYNISKFEYKVDVREGLQIEFSNFAHTPCKNLQQLHVISCSSLLESI